MSSTIDLTSAIGRLENLEAYLVSLEQGTAAGLALLQEKDEPDAIRRRLSILIDAGRYQDAVALILHRPPHERWAEKAIYVLIQNSDLVAAKELLNWSRSQELPLARRCAIHYATARCEHLSRARETGGPILPGDVSPEEAELLRDVLETLAPLTLPARTARRIRTAVEAIALDVALRAYLLLGQASEAQATGDLLATYRPVPVGLASLVLQGSLEPPADLPDRLRRDHRDSLDAQLKAALIEGEQLQRPAPAFEAVMPLLNDTRSLDEQRSILSVANDLAQRLGPEALTRVSELASLLLPANDRFRQLLSIDRLLRQGKVADAALRLEELSDEHDPYWFQLYATMLHLRGAGRAAADAFIRAGELHPHPDLFCRAAAITRDQGRLPDAAALLEKVLKMRPEDGAARRELAAVYTALHDHANAARHFAALQVREPEEISHRLNYAVALARSGDLHGSLAVFDALCQPPGPPLQAVVGKAEVLKALGRAPAAFDCMIQWKETYWNDPAYVRLVIDLAFRSSEEKIGDEALEQLQKLQREGKAEVDLVQEVSLEEMIAFSREQSEQRDILHQLLLEGKIPWLLADEAMGLVPYLGWSVRTQPLPWIADDPIRRASSCIYATNGFALVQADGTRQLRALTSPGPAMPVVADLSSLITLDRLGLLPQAAGYFGQLVVPAIYLARVLEEAARLAAGQQSREAALATIKAALDAGRLASAPVGSPAEESDLPFVKEYDSDPDHPCYRIADLLIPLHRAGRLTDRQYREAQDIARQPARSDNRYPPIQLDTRILVGLPTMITLCQLDIFETVIRSFQVAILPEHRSHLAVGLQGISKQEEVRQWHANLWEQIREGDAFLKAVVVPTPGMEAAAAAAGPSVLVASALLAQQTGLPLMADDRALQVWAGIHRAGAANVTFGTDRLLLAMGEAGQLSADQVADALLSLVRWRYRFLVLPAEVLQTLASRYASHPPGDSLREVALYVHDCMRDPGLFGGLEPTTPPSSMASQFFQAWLQAIAGFITGVWADVQFTVEGARLITRWAAREIIPSPPKSMGPQAVVLASLIPKTVLSYALLGSVDILNIDRANACLQMLADSLCLSSEEYLEIVTGVLHDL